MLDHHDCGVRYKTDQLAGTVWVMYHACEGQPLSCASGVCALRPSCRGLSNFYKVSLLPDSISQSFSSPARISLAVISRSLSSAESRYHRRPHLACSLRAPMSYANYDDMHQQLEAANPLASCQSYAPSVQHDRYAEFG